MKILALNGLFICLLAPLLLHAQKGEGRYELSPHKSKVSWTVMQGDDELTGHFKLKSGYVELIGQDLKSLVVFVDIQSLVCTKCGSQENTKKLISFLKSSEFFNSRSMDYAVFKMYDSELKGEGEYLVKGGLSITGYTQNISATATILTRTNTIAGEAMFSINRDLWNLKNPPDDDNIYNVSSEVKLRVNLEGELKN
ncbi:MAG: YceI family protein [Vicingaceae bacterium]